MKPELIDVCGNCDNELREGMTFLYDDRSLHYFCDEQCYDEWAEDKGSEIVREFYRELNVSEVDT